MMLMSAGLSLASWAIFNEASKLHWSHRPQSESLISLALADLACRTCSETQTTSASRIATSTRAGDQNSSCHLSRFLCELLHLRSQAGIPRCGLDANRGVADMSDKPSTGMPDWLTTDMLVIAISIAIIALGIWIAP
ncbi:MULTISPECIES: hypothetical protein [unclassified Bradyrhizobium]|uniref:hypothetical protein n=1 Tax=unclassified Bradyrhizobium TaxID=2631580 RepID=UPI000402AB84|nr:MULTISPECIES: hypothetical protein [unclassified Bradyrhizobium]QIG91015.1 hypothetical protein G6P99_09110 [Bradyrhizobium sp. 6(2017)]